MSEHTPLTEAEREVNRVARILMAAWEEAEGKRVGVSYVATFADMARAVLAARTSTATADTGLRERVEALLSAPGRHDRDCALRDAADAACSCWRGQLRAALDGTAAPTTDTGARDE